MSLMAVVLSQTRRILSKVLRIDTDYTTTRAVYLDTIPTTNTTVNTINSNTTPSQIASDTQNGLNTNGYNPTRAGYLDNLPNLDTNVNSRLSDANASTRVQTGLTNQGYTTTLATNLTSATASGSIIKSIQRGTGTVTVSIGSSPNFINGFSDVVISTVTMAKSVVIVNGTSTNAGSTGAPSTHMYGYGAQLTSSTQVRVYQTGMGMSVETYSTTIEFTVVEFN